MFKQVIGLCDVSHFLFKIYQILVFLLQPALLVAVCSEPAQGGAGYKLGAGPCLLYADKSAASVSVAVAFFLKVKRLAAFDTLDCLKQISLVAAEEILVVRPFGVFIFLFKL